MLFKTNDTLPKFVLKKVSPLLIQLMDSCFKVIKRTRCKSCFSSA